MVFFDGHAFVGLKGSYRIPYVFDNLIYRREMPVTIGVFINPGHTPDQKEATDSEWGDGPTTAAWNTTHSMTSIRSSSSTSCCRSLKKNYNISP